MILRSSRTHDVGAQDITTGIKVNDAHEYFPDGAAWIDSGIASTVDGHLFSSKAFDTDTGFYDFGQRFYDPRTSLWLGIDSSVKRDPMTATKNVGYLAVSSFARDNPESFTDPNGSDFVWVNNGKYSGYFHEPSNSSRVDILYGDAGRDRANQIAYNQLESDVVQERSALVSAAVGQILDKADKAGHAWLDHWSTFGDRLHARAEHAADLRRDTSREDAETDMDMFGIITVLGAGPSISPRSSFIEGLSAPRGFPELDFTGGGPLGNIGDAHAGMTVSDALRLGESWLGKGYTEMGPRGTGVFRSADGLRQFRMGPYDILGSHGKIGAHLHFESINPITGKAFENLHVKILDP